MRFHLESARFFLFSSMLATGVVTARGTQSLIVEFGDSPAQTFSGWGVHPCDSDPVKENFHWFPEAIRLFQGLKIDIVKCIAKPECFRGQEEGSLNTDFIDASLVAQLQLMKQAGVTHYMLAVEAPPKAFRHYYSDEGLVDMHPNGLLQTEEKNYSHLLVSLLRYLVSRGVGAPDAVVLQSSPNLKIQFGACVMPSDQLLRILASVRMELHQDDELSGVRLAGPDLIGYSASLDYLKPLSEKSPNHISDSIDVILVQPSDEPTNFNSFRDFVSISPLSNKEIWASGWAPVQVSTEAAGVMQTIERLCYDFNIAAVNRWFWSQAYFNERTPRGLIYGTGKRTGLYPLFAKLTEKIRPGSRVLPVKVTSSSQVPTPPQIVAFADTARITLLIGNPTNNDMSIRLATKTAETKQANVDTLVPGRLDWTQKTVNIADDKIIVSAQTIAVIDFHL